LTVVMWPWFRHYNTSKLNWAKTV